MTERILIVLTFLMIIFFIGAFVCVKTKLDQVENRLALERAEIEEMKKNQRLTSQDVMFLEDMLQEVAGGKK